MTEQRNLARFATISNAAFNSISANATAITSMSVGGHTINATSFAGTANNANNLGGVAAASYQLNSALAANVVTMAANSATFANSSATNTFTVGTAAYFVANGNVGIGTSSPGTRFDVNGNIRGQGDISVENNTAEGGRLRVINTSKTGNTTFDWSIWNMTGVYGNGLSFWRYYGNGTNAGSAMFLADSGNVGIGTSSPNATLAVSGTANVSGNVTVGGSINAANVTATVFTGNLTGTASSVTNGVYTSGDQTVGGIKTFNGSLRNITSDWSSFYLGGGQGGYLWMHVGGDASNELRFGRVNRSTFAWEANPFVMNMVSGAFTATGNITAFSDVRLKANIHPLQDSLYKVQQIQGVSYERKSDGEKKIGFIAQDLQKILPEVVIENHSGMLSVDYGNIVALLVEAIKEQQTQIESLRNEIETLKTK